MKFYVSHEGAASLGVPGEIATVELDVESVPVDSQADYVEQVRTVLAAAFGVLWDTTVSVVTEHEMNAIAEVRSTNADSI